MQPSKIDHESLATEVKRAQAGELGAFHGLVVRFQDMAVGYAFSLLGDYHLAEDAAQEAFLDTFRKLPTLQHPEAFVSWLRTVVFKHCDRLRRRRPATESLAEEDERLTADGMEPAIAAEQAEIARLVGQAIGSLPPGQREVVSLYYIGQRSGGQVATFLDLPLTTVKKRLHDAKPKLRRSMSGMAKHFLESNRPSRDARFADRVLRLASPDPPKTQRQSTTSSRQRITLHVVSGGPAGSPTATPTGMCHAWRLPATVTMSNALLQRSTPTT